MNDQQDHPTEPMQPAEPAERNGGKQPRAKTELHPDAVRWRNIAAVVSVLFVCTLGLLGWQLTSNDSPSLTAQRGVPGSFGGRGPGTQLNGQGPDGAGGLGGPPQPPSGSPNGGAGAQGQSQGRPPGQSGSMPRPGTRAS